MKSVNLKENFFLGASSSKLVYKKLYIFIAEACLMLIGSEDFFSFECLTVFLLCFIVFCRIHAIPKRVSDSVSFRYFEAFDVT